MLTLYCVKLYFSLSNVMNIIPGSIATIIFTQHYLMQQLPFERNMNADANNDTCTTRLNYVTCVTMCFK